MLASLAKRRGFIFQSSEIYGGLGSTWDYGPLGVELKRNVKEIWWRRFVLGRDDMVGLDSAILMHPKVWEASGHVSSFSDPLVECLNDHSRWRLDQMSTGGSLKPSFDIGTLVTVRRSDVEPFDIKFVALSGLTLSAPDDSTRLDSAHFIGPGDTHLEHPQPISLPNLPNASGSTALTDDRPISQAPERYHVVFQFPLGAKPGKMKIILTFKNKRGWLSPIQVDIDSSGLAFGAEPSWTVDADSVPCPKCGWPVTEPRQFNLMFKTFLGPVADTASEAYLRPETAQGIFVNFENVQTTTRRRPPFGIAQVGKAFRNEITTGNFIFRTREFEMMEIEFFVPPGTDDGWHERWVTEAKGWYTSLGIAESALRVREHEGKELAHYAKATHDVEYEFPWGWGELAGVANRTDFDLKAHTEATGRDLSYFEEGKGHIVPYVIEPSFGVDRALMALLVDAYTEDEVVDAKGKPETRVVLRLHPSVAPIKVAVLPLSKKEPLAKLARDVFDGIRGSGAIAGVVQYDDTQSIGRRYRRQDEVGTPLCVTVDFESLDDRAVTIRSRDSMEQVRVPIDGLARELADRLGG